MRTFKAAPGRNVVSLTTACGAPAQAISAGDRRDAVAELVERQIVEDDVDQPPERGRGVGLPELAPDVVRISRSGSWSSVPR